MDTQRKQHPSALHLAAMALGKLAHDSASNIQSHLDKCTDCRSFVADTPRGELAEILNRAKGELSTQNTMAASLSGTTANLRNPPSNSVAAAEPSAVPTSSRASVASDHTVASGDLPGDLIGQSKYRFLRVLGRGGMGTVYEAEHVRMGRRVAIKVINPEFVDHPQAILRFEKEIQAVASLDHVNVARAFDAENIGPHQAIIMEYVHGQTLYDFLKSRGRLSVVDACRSVGQAFTGLQHAHEQGLVHRDLKPQNLMLARDTGQIKILDFGLAKAVSENRQSHGLTGSRATMGTYAYMAPEQALDAANADIRADIYSLGCTLYLLISGVLPFACDVDTKLLLAHQNEIPKPLKEICPEVPEALSELVARMLAKNPADRPQTPREAANVLLPFARGASGAEVAKRACVSSSTKSRLSMDGRTWGGIAAALVALFCFSGWAAGWFSVRTADGTIIVENVPQDAQVSVDGQKVAVTRNGESLAIAAMKRGSHHLVVTQNNRDLWTNDVAVTVAGELVRVKFEPTSENSAGSTPEMATKNETASASDRREAEQLFPLYSHWTGKLNKNDATATVINLEGNIVVLEVRVPDLPTRQFRCAVDQGHVTVLKNDAIGHRPDGSPAAVASKIDIDGTIVGKRLSLSGTQAQWDPKHRRYAPSVTFKLTLQQKDTDAKPSSAATQNAESSLSPDSVWEGKRFYRKGAWDKESETYFLHVTTREGEKFSGVVFSNGPQKNQAEVEGEIAGPSIRWVEHSGQKTVSVQGTINDAGRIIQLTFHGTWKDQSIATDGDGELSAVPKSGAGENK